MARSSGNSSSSSSGGIGFTGMLTVLFIALKLIPAKGGGHLINWSWWWVLSPLWIGTIIGLIVLGIVILIIAIKD